MACAITDADAGSCSYRITTTALRDSSVGIRNGQKTVPSARDTRAGETPNMAKYAAVEAVAVAVGWAIKPHSGRGLRR